MQVRWRFTTAQAYIGGKPGDITSKDHTFRPGETVEKQLIVVNNSRETVACECAWSLGLPRPIAVSKKVSVPTGDQERIPLRFDLPDTLSAGTYDLTATVRFRGQETQQDSFTINVLPRPADLPAARQIALFDPRGETARLLAGLGIRFQKVKEDTDLSSDEVLIMGKEALTSDGPGPDVGRVREGLKVVVFEQAAKVLDDWSKRSLVGKQDVYVWTDGAHFNIRQEEDRQCILVLMGARANSHKERIHDAMPFASPAP